MSGGPPLLPWRDRLEFFCGLGTARLSGKASAMSDPAPRFPSLEPRRPRRGLNEIRLSRFLFRRRKGHQEDRSESKRSTLCSFCDLGVKSVSHSVVITRNPRARAPALQMFALDPRRPFAVGSILPQGCNGRTKVKNIRRSGLRSLCVLRVKHSSSVSVRIFRGLYLRHTLPRACGPALHVFLHWSHGALAVVFPTANESKAGTRNWTSIGTQKSQTVGSGF